MSTSTTGPTGQYEFDEPQNQTIGTLARRMALVGLVMIFFGMMQMFNGVTSMMISRNPERMIAAAEKAGMSQEQLGLLKQAVSGSFWSSPLTVSALAFAVSGLLLLLIGAWTRQAAGGFAGIVQTKGQDVSRLMDALGALNLKYGMIYYMLLIAALISLVSLAISLWHSWRGGA